MRADKIEVDEILESMRDDKTELDEEIEEILYSRSQ